MCFCTLEETTLKRETTSVFFSWQVYCISKKLLKPTWPIRRNSNCLASSFRREPWINSGLISLNARLFNMAFLPLSCMNSWYKFFMSMSNVLSRFWANTGVLNAAFSPFITVVCGVWVCVDVERKQTHKHRKCRYSIEHFCM